MLKSMKNDELAHILSTDPIWYVTLADFLAEYFYTYDGDETAKSDEWLTVRSDFVELVKQLLVQGKLQIATTGPNIDMERKPIDTIVIHHSATKKLENFTLEHINALSLIRIFAPVHADPHYDAYKKPIWSNHFYKGQQTFVVYHYLIWPDGRSEQVLGDEAVGWQAGNWDINCRSVAICFIGDYRKVSPSQLALQKAQQIMQKYPSCKVIPHKQANPRTSCPGDPYFGDNGWHKELQISQP